MAHVGKERMIVWLPPEVLRLLRECCERRGTQFAEEIEAAIRLNHKMRVRER